MGSSLLNATSPEYFGFFLTEASSKIIMQKAKNYFDKCFDYFPSFKNISVGKTRSESFDKIYNMNYDKLLHSTTSHMNDSAYIPYMENPIVKNSIGKHFTIRIEGFFFTPRTAGAAIKLTRTNLKLFNKNDYFSFKKDVNGKTYPTFPNKFIDSDTTYDTANKTPDNDFKLDVDSQNYQLLSTQMPPNHSVISLRKGSRAHLTLGLQDGIVAVQTGFDLMSLKYKRIMDGGCEADFVVLDNGIVNESVTFEGANGIGMDVIKCGDGAEDVMVKDGDSYVSYGGEDCEVRLNLSLPVGCIFNAIY